jgi:hypothetical protein
MRVVSENEAIRNLAMSQNQPKSSLIISFENIKIYLGFSPHLPCCASNEAVGCERPVSQLRKRPNQCLP